MNGAPLVVGYGNTLRTDDGLGPLAAEYLASDPRMAGVTVIARHQLTTDLVVDLHEATLAVFIDASRDVAAGMVAVQEVSLADAAEIGAWSHQVDVAALIALTAALYGAAPPAVVVSMGVDSVDAGERPSAVVEAAMPALVDAVVRVVGQQVPERA